MPHQYGEPLENSIGIYFMDIKMLITGLVGLLIGGIIAGAICTNLIHHDAVAHGYATYVNSPCGCGSTFTWNK